MSAIVPIPKCEITIRLATTADLSFLDSLQKQHNKALGFFPRAQMEGYVSNQWVLIAQDVTGKPIGYCASRDRYLKRDELGIIYQLCVAPGLQRKLVGAALVREVFARSAYGCRLYCCWCAQDLEANRFWESMGFVPIAFRAGSSGKQRVHIFWQKRIVEGDAETKWWYPFQTNGGAIRADRIVFPIPPGTHWTEVQAVSHPSAESKVLSAESKAPPKRRNQHSALRTQHLAKPMGGFRFQSQVEEQPRPKPATKKPKPPAAKLDPKFLSAARELRDRWMEKVNEEPALLTSQGKYDVGRLPEDQTLASPVTIKQLPQAA